MAIAHVQTDGGTDSGVTVFNQAQGSSPAVGNLIVVTTRSVSKLNTYTVTDSLGNTYTPFTGHPVRASLLGGSVYSAYCKNATNAANTVTVTYSGVDNPGVVVSEFSGIDVDAGIDTHAEQGGGTSATTDSGSGATTAVADELIYGYFTDNNDTGNGRHVGSGFTSPAAANQRGMAEYKIVSATGAYKAIGTLDYDPSGFGGNWICIMGSFRASGGAPALVGVDTWASKTENPQRARTPDAHLQPLLAPPAMMAPALSAWLPISPTVARAPAHLVEYGNLTTEPLPLISVSIDQWGPRTADVARAPARTPGMGMEFEINLPILAPPPTLLPFYHAPFVPVPAQSPRLADYGLFQVNPFEMLPPPPPPVPSPEEPPPNRGGIPLKGKPVRKLKYYDEHGRPKPASHWFFRH